MNNWISTLFNIGGRQNILKMFGRRKNNRGMIRAPVLALGISATAYGLRGNRNRNMLRPVQNVMNNIRTQTAGNMPNVAVITGFAKK
jgi:hypothetical protein